MQAEMLGIHKSTYDAVFQHPVARNLQWRDVHALLSSLADQTQENNDNVKFTRNGQTLTVRPPRRKDFSDIQELMRIRHFLEGSGAPSQEAVAEGMHLLVVIDHREARIFKSEMHGSVPQHILPYDPRGMHRHLRNVGDDSNGQRKPEDNRFYQAIAWTLSGAEKILIFGSGTGAGSAMDRLVTTLKNSHPELARRIVGTVVVNEQHMSDDQLLAQARAFYAAGHA